MKKPTKPNTPLEDLSEEEQVDLVIVLGIFANMCKVQLDEEEQMPLHTILLSCLKLYDMNFLHIKKTGEQYIVRTTEIPISIVQHLVDSDSKRELVPAKVTYLVDKFVELTHKNQNFFANKKVRRKNK